MLVSVIFMINIMQREKIFKCATEGKRERERERERERKKRRESQG